MKNLNNVDMSQYTSFRAGGLARRLVIVDEVSELLDVLEETEGSDRVFLGNGTNTLFAEEVYEGTVIKLGEGFDYINIDGTKVNVGAATLLPSLSKAVGSMGLTGLEFAGGIPGSIGGAVFMNAGAYGGEIKDVLIKVKVAHKNSDGHWEVCDLPKASLDLSYRHSTLMSSGDIVLEAEFLLEEGDVSQIQEYMKELTEKRVSKQPLEYPSAGSFFKRPEGYFAGKLVDDAGLAGFTVGGAQVSEKHCGFVINRGGATAEDILSLMVEVQKRVKEQFGVDLEPEIRIIR